MMSLTLLRAGNPLADAGRQVAILEAAAGMAAFADELAARGLGPLVSERIEVLQVNVGKRCNQTCRHCHVDAGPDRRELMSRNTLEQCLRVLREARIRTVDITGGAPELHPEFKWFVAEARRGGARVIDRSNLTILVAPGHQELPEFLASHQVEIIASLPCYLAENGLRRSPDRAGAEPGLQSPGAAAAAAAAAPGGRLPAAAWGAARRDV